MRSRAVVLLVACVLVSSCSFIDSLFKRQVATPLISASGSSSPVSITMSTETDGATIYYTTDGSMPDPGSFLSGTTAYSAPVVVYDDVTVKAIATKEPLEDSDVATLSLDVTPVTLSVGESHTFNGIKVTLDAIFWRRYLDWFGETVSTHNIALQFSITNQTGTTINTNPIYSWGALIASSGSVQLNSVYVGDLYDSNCQFFNGYEILNTATVTDTAVFEEAPFSATSFQFKGEPPYHDDLMQSLAYYFEVSFDRTEIVQRPIP